MSGIAQEILQLEKLMAAGPIAVAEACLLTRKLGYGLRTKDLVDWPVADREHLIWRARLYADVPEDIFNSWLMTGKQHGMGFSQAKIRSKAQRYRAAALAEERKAKTISTDGLELYVADIAEVQSLRLGRANLVLTDPPYERAALPLWGSLVKFADRVLETHGWLLAMSGQRWLPDVFRTMEDATKDTEMRYCWTISVHTPGGQSAQGWIGRRNALNTEWKPILVYSKGEPEDWPAGFRDHVLSESRDKRYHEWGQNVRVFQQLSDVFSAPSALVCDPFLGGGTTAMAARPTRPFEGFDISAAAVTTATERIQSDKEPA